MQSVHGKSYIRYNKAKEQAGYATVDVDINLFNMVISQMVQV